MEANVTFKCAEILGKEPCESEIYEKDKNNKLIIVLKEEIGIIYSLWQKTTQSLRQVGRQHGKSSVKYLYLYKVVSYWKQGLNEVSGKLKVKNYPYPKNLFLYRFFCSSVSLLLTNYCNSSYVLRV